MAQIQERGVIVNKTVLRKPGKTALAFGLMFILAFIAQTGLSSSTPFNASQESQLERSKIDREIYPLLNDTDLYCSFRVFNQGSPELQIVGAEREKEKSLLSDGDVIYISQGKQHGMEPGMIFIILSIEEKVPGVGPIAFKKGRARLVALSESQSSAVVEKSCGGAMIGHFLIPFEPKESIIGKDLGFDIPPFEVDGIKGKFIYLETDTLQLGTGGWGLIDIGMESGIQVGQQLIVYRKVREDAPIQVFGNVVVIDAQETTSTVKVLSCRDAIKIGDLIMVRPNG